MTYKLVPTSEWQEATYHHELDPVGEARSSCFTQPRVVKMAAVQNGRDEPGKQGTSSENGLGYTAWTGPKNVKGLEVLHELFK